MPLQEACSLCGQPIQFADLDGEKIKLDLRPVFDGPFRLVGEEQERAERITRPGFYGYTPHDETCPKRAR